MRNFIKSELELLGPRLAEIPVDLRRITPWRIAITLAVMAVMVYFLYYSPIVLDLGYWVRYGSFPRR